MKLNVNKQQVLPRWLCKLVPNVLIPITDTFRTARWSRRFHYATYITTLVDGASESRENQGDASIGTNSRIFLRRFRSQRWTRYSIRSILGQRYKFSRVRRFFDETGWGELRGDPLVLEAEAELEPVPPPPTPPPTPEPVPPPPTSPHCFLRWFRSSWDFVLSVLDKWVVQIYSVSKNTGSYSLKDFFSLRWPTNSGDPK